MTPDRCRRHRLAVAGGAAVAVLVLAGPRAAHAAGLFPVDGWLGSGLRGAGDVVLGPLKLGAGAIARLLVTIVGALADLLVPKSLVKAGLDGIRWLVQLPPVGKPVGGNGAGLGVRMPHLQQLREVLTWIGITLLPLGVILAAGRAYLAPGIDGESPSEILSRVLVAGLGLVVYDWAWGVVTELVRLITDALLGLPWVADGIERMLETLLIGGASGTAVAAEFVIPLMLVVAGGMLLGLLLVHIGLMVATALVYVLGGLLLGLSVTSFGRRVFAGGAIAAGAGGGLRVLWAVVFVTGAALMLDAQPAAGAGGFGGFVAQLFNVAAAAGTFFVAIKLALAVFRNATGAITGVTSTAAPTTARANSSPGARGLAANATPAGLARFSGQLRSRAAALAGAGARVAARPLASPARSVGTASWATQHPVQATGRAAGALRSSMAGGRVSAAAAGDAVSARAATRAHAARA